jgi:hypothetical protein
MWDTLSLWGEGSISNFGTRGQRTVRVTITRWGEGKTQERSRRNCRNSCPWVPRTAPHSVPLRGTLRYRLL